MSKIEGIYEAKVIAKEPIEGFSKKSTYYVKVARKFFGGYTVTPITGHDETEDVDRRLRYKTVYALQKEWDLKREVVEGKSQGSHESIITSPTAR